MGTRFLSLVLLVIGVSGCDMAGSGSDQIVGSWEQILDDVTTVVSSVDQAYLGFYDQLEGEVVLGGALHTSLSFYGEEVREELVVLNDPWNYFYLNLSPNNTSIYWKVLGSGGTARSYDLPAIEYEVGPGGMWLNVPYATLDTPDGPIKIGGMVYVKSIEIRAGVPTSLPVRRAMTMGGGLLEYEFRENGTFVRSRSDNVDISLYEGVWDFDGDVINLSFSRSDISDFSMHYDDNLLYVEGGALRRSSTLLNDNEGLSKAAWSPLVRTTTAPLGVSGEGPDVTPPLVARVAS